MTYLYKMFIDDERFPATPDSDWEICRSLDDVQETVARLGMPYFITFDHDLGDQVPTGHDVLKWLISQDQDEIHKLPRDFKYDVHSMNPVGAANIRSLMDGYLKFKG